MESCVISRPTVILFFLFLCFFSFHNPQFISETMYLWSSKAGNISFKERKRHNVVTTANDITPPKIGGARGRLLGGPGSSPPQCTSKCGMCTPCKPVHVPATTPGHGRVYYSEAWRCKCGNKLYMP